MGNNNSEFRKSRSSDIINLTHIHPPQFQKTNSSTATTTTTASGHTAGSEINIYKVHPQQYSDVEIPTRSSTIQESGQYRTDHQRNSTVIVNQYTDETDAERAPFKMVTEDSEINDALPTDVTDIAMNGKYEEAVNRARAIVFSLHQSPQSVPVQNMIGESRKIDNPLDIGKKVWVLSNNTQLWRECVVKDHKEEICGNLGVRKLQVRIHYISFSYYYDEWLDYNSPRIACMYCIKTFSELRTMHRKQFYVSIFPYICTRTIQKSVNCTCFVLFLN